MQDEHSFRATVKMYKSRLKGWNARKYMTMTERDIICRALRDKKCRGKTYGRVIFRGKDRKLDVFLRHTGQSRVFAHQPDAVDSDGLSQDIIIEGLVSLAPLPIISPANLGGTVRILCREMSHLVMKTPEEGLSYELFYAVKQACIHFQNRFTERVRISLNVAAEWFRANIAARPALTLMSLLRSQTITGYDEIYLTKIFKGIYNRLSNLTKEIYGSQHLVTSLVLHILRLSSEPKLMQSAYQHVVPHVIDLLQKHKSSETYRWQESLALKLSKSGEEAKAGALLVEGVSSFVKDDVYKERNRWKCVLSLARHYIRHALDKDDEAE